MAVLRITRKREKELDELAVGHPGCKPSLDRAPVPISVETHRNTIDFRKSEARFWHVNEAKELFSLCCNAIYFLTYWCGAHKQ
jgi:hypothetical protein